MGDEADTKRRAEPPPRRPYRRPRLERLGTLTELTAAVATNARNDHVGHAPLNKTS
jgi:hypothetical protein